VFIGRFDRHEKLTDRVDGRGAGRPVIEHLLESVDERTLLAEEDVLLALVVGEDRAG
jgi:hypothetical protein